MMRTFTTHMLMQSFLLGRQFRSRYGAAIGLDGADDRHPLESDSTSVTPAAGKPPNGFSVSAPRARAPTERININCHPMASTIDTGLGIALGMFSGEEASAAAASAAAIMAASMGMPDLLLDCHCRMDGLLIGTVDCAAACLQLGDDAFPSIPSVNVRGEQVHSVSQHRVCAGWRDWLWQLYSDDSWKQAAASDFVVAREAIREVLGGERLMIRSAPEGECLGCLAGNSTDFNWLLLEESVWENVVSHDADGMQYADQKTNTELLTALHPAAEFALKVCAHCLAGRVCGHADYG